MGKFVCSPPSTGLLVRTIQQSGDTKGVIDASNDSGRMDLARWCPPTAHTKTWYATKTSKACQFSSLPWDLAGSFASSNCSSRLRYLHGRYLLILAIDVSRSLSRKSSFALMPRREHVRRFPTTGTFENYRHSFITAPCRAKPRPQDYRF